jgi:hypothetical protein
MKRWAAGLIVSAALLAPAAPAGAAISSDAKKACGPTGSAAACKEYLYKQCVAAAKKQGLSDSQAKLVCGG